MNTRQQRLPINILRRPIFKITVLVLFGIISASRVAAQLNTTTADIIDWDLPSLKGAGACPSSIGAVTLPPSGDPVYYVTFGACPAISPNNPGREGPVMIKFTPGTPLASGQATWRAWNLGGLIETTGGMKITRDERVAFVRTAREIIRVNMTTNVLTHWVDVTDTADPASWSDLALVERCGGYIDVYTAQNDALNAGIIQRLTVQNGSNNATVKRWVVDGGAGAEYLSGVAFNSGNGKVYFSEGLSNNIGELDPNTNRVRRWSLTAADPMVASPRQVSVDTKGVVWVVTASGHLVSLNPCTNQMAAYLIPGAGGLPSPGAAANPFGIGPSGGIVGFTEADGKKVGMLIPNKQTVCVTPSCQTAMVICDSIPGTTECINTDSGCVMPQLKAGQPAVHTDLDPFGEFVEATLPDTGNFPLGIFRDVQRSVGNFWAVVEQGGANPNGLDHRLSHVAFPVSSSCGTGGLATGGGTIGDSLPSPDDVLTADMDDWAPSNRATFGLTVYTKYGNTVRGDLYYTNNVTGEQVKSVSLTAFQVIGNRATISGTCTRKLNGIETPCTFDVTVVDNGYPGKGRDTFNISGLGIVPNGDTLNGGNIKVYQ